MEMHVEYSHKYHLDGNEVWEIVIWMADGIRFSEHFLVRDVVDKIKRPRLTNLRGAMK